MKVAVLLFENFEGFEPSGPVEILASLKDHYRFSDGFFYDKGKNAAWWSSSPKAGSSTSGMFWFMSYNFSEAVSASARYNGYSVRCIKD